jgi:glycosyltransferase involved in cell wall biosynthesis
VPTVSICLPVFNGEESLARAIESVLAQTYTDFELLIADDMSQDSSWQIAQGYAKFDKRIVLWQQSSCNLGKFVNYNAIMKRASGKYIKLFAQDDLLAPLMLTRVMEAFAADSSIVLVSTLRQFINESISVDSQNSQLDHSRIVAGADAIFGCLLPLRNWIGELSTVTFLASSIGQGFDAKLHRLADLEYWLRILTGGNYAFICEPLCSLGASPGDKKMKDLLVALDALRIVHVYGGYAAVGCVSEKELVRQVLKSGELSVYDLINREGLTAKELSSVEVQNVDKDEFVKQLSELLYLALYFAGEQSLQLRSMQSELGSELSAVEDQLSNMQNSPAWRFAQKLGLAKQV